MLTTFRGLDVSRETLIGNVLRACVIANKYVNTQRGHMSLKPQGITKKGTAQPPPLH